MERWQQFHGDMAAMTGWLGATEDKLQASSQAEDGAPLNDDLARNLQQVCNTPLCS